MYRAWFTLGTFYFSGALLLKKVILDSNHYISEYALDFPLIIT